MAASAVLTVSVCVATVDDVGRFEKKAQVQFTVPMFANIYGYGSDKFRPRDGVPPYTRGNLEAVGLS